MIRISVDKTNDGCTTNVSADGSTSDILIQLALGTMHVLQKLKENPDMPLDALLAIYARILYDIRTDDGDDIHIIDEKRMHDAAAPFLKEAQS